MCHLNCSEKLPIKYLFMCWLIPCTWLWLSGRGGVRTLEDMEGPCFYLVDKATMAREQQ